MTYKQRLIRGLLALGYTQVESASRKYEVFQKLRSDDGSILCRLHVGKAGALRSGHTATNSRSIGTPDNQTTFYAGILKAGEAQASQTPTTP